MDHLRYIVLQPVFNSSGTKQSQTRLHLAEDLFQTLFFLQQVLLSNLNFNVELLQLLFINNLHGEVERSQALQGGILAELVHCFYQFFVLAAYLKALLDL